MEEDELLAKRLRELADKAYRNNMYTFTGFLGLSQLSVYYQMEKELSYIPVQLSGGSSICERLMIRFGNEELFGYEEEFPIVCLEIRPLLQKFADELSHRDFLGALMNLGIERSTLGDIIIRENRGFLFCTDAIAPFIMEQLTKIKHTSVICERAKEIPKEKQEDLREIKVQLASERIDGVIARVLRVSRSDSVLLFRQKKVFLNGRLCENNSAVLKPGDTVTVRGSGKFVFAGCGSLSKKGKLNATVYCYGK